MASSSGALDVGQDIKSLKAQLYEACLQILEETPDIVFHQQEIVDLDIIPNDDVQVLLAVVQGLVDERLFKVVHQAGVGWKLRTKDEAKKYRTLTPEQEIVYGLIDESGSDGIWSRTIKMKSNLHDAVFRQAIKSLEQKSMITDMKSVEHPTRKMYLKSSLRPSERATGGPWFTDGEMDEAFVEGVMKILLDHIKKKTFYISRSYGSPKMAKKTIQGIKPEDARAARDKALGPRTEALDEKSRKQLDFESHLPMPAGYQGYPSANDLTLYIENGQFLSQTLTETDIQQLLDIMCYDNLIERILQGESGVSYRALRKTLLDPDEVGSLHAELPCGRCPVFDLCEEGGPVSPSNCEYFTDWLNL